MRLTVTEIATNPSPPERREGFLDEQDYTLTVRSADHATLEVTQAMKLRRDVFGLNWMLTAVTCPYDLNLASGNRLAG
jgi:hypothetical protein